MKYHTILDEDLREDNAKSIVYLVMRKRISKRPGVVWDKFIDHEYQDVDLAISARDTCSRDYDRGKDQTFEVFETTQKFRKI